MDFLSDILQSDSREGQNLPQQRRRWPLAYANSISSPRRLLCGTARTLLCGPGGNLEAIALEAGDVIAFPTGEGAVAEASMAWCAGKVVVGYKADGRSLVLGHDNAMISGLIDFQTVPTPAQASHRVRQFLGASETTVAVPSNQHLDWACISRRPCAPRTGWRRSPTRCLRLRGASSAGLVPWFTAVSPQKDAADLPATASGIAGRRKNFTRRLPPAISFVWRSKA